MPGGAPWCPSHRGTSGTRALLGGQPGRSAGGSSSGPSRCLDPSALAGVPVLLVAHEGPVVAQDVHGVLPVPAGAAVVLETGLVSTEIYRKGQFLYISN